MTKTKKGFTIIEVVLVLAIAGLIFLMVFIALPALQRSQRNTRRRSDMARILAKFTEYQSNNGGRMPGSGDLNNFVQKYVGASGQNATGSTTCDGDQFCDPDGTPYSIRMEAYSSNSEHGGSSTESSAYYDGNGMRSSGPTETAITHVIHYWPSTRCGNEGIVEKTSGPRDVAVAYYLEGGAIYCGDNQ